jgi:hypothetical protein
MIQFKMQSFVLEHAEGIFGPKEAKETGEWRRGHNEDLNV